MMDDWCHKYPNYNWGWTANHRNFSSRLDDFCVSEGPDFSWWTSPLCMLIHPLLGVKCEISTPGFFALPSNHLSTQLRKQNRKSINDVWISTSNFESWLPPPKKCKVINQKTTDFCKPRNAPPFLSGIFFVSQRHSMRTHGVKCLKRHGLFWWLFVGGGAIFQTVDRFQPMITWLFSQSFCSFLMSLTLHCFWFFSWSFFLRSTIFGIFFRHLDFQKSGHHWNTKTWRFAIEDLNERVRKSRSATPNWFSNLADTVVVGFLGILQL